jgi:hypothetical protein
MKGHRVLRQSQNSPRHVCSVGLAVVLALSSASAIRACGYHDDVSIARGMLNWVYPDALHVIGAMSSAVVEKKLSHHVSESNAPSLFGSQYRATVKALERLAELLEASSEDEPRLSFSLVVVEPMLWTHFEVGPRGAHAQVHAPGPQPDELVLVSSENVIHGIANKELGIGEAHRLGMIRCYGTERQIARFREQVDKVHDRRSRLEPRNETEG